MPSAAALDIAFVVKCLHGQPASSLKIGHR